MQSEAIHPGHHPNAEKQQQGRHAETASGLSTNTLIISITATTSIILLLVISIISAKVKQILAYPNNTCTIMLTPSLTKISKIAFSITEHIAIEWIKFYDIL